MQHVSVGVSVVGGFELVDPARAVSAWKRMIVPFGVVGAIAVGIPVLFAGMGGSGFLPHLFCYLGNPRLVWTHVISDSLIGLSYLAISLTLLYIVRRSQGVISFHWLVLAFGLFIVACGATHVMEVVTVWRPYYWASGSVKVITAGASLATAIALPLVTPTILERLHAAEVSEDRRTKLQTAYAELQRLNAELKQIDNLKSALITQQAARIGGWEWNMKSGENKWSEPVEVMHGLAPGSYDGRYESWWATVHPDDRAVVAEAIKRATETGHYDVEYRTLRADGSTYWTAARGNVINGPDGSPEKMLGICMDVTARKRSEEALLKAEKLAAAGRMAATVAHEINNPLEAVMNLLFLARTSGQDPQPLLALADRELSRVAAITRQTLGFYRDSSSPTLVQVEELLDEVLRLYESRLEAKRLTVNRIVQSSPSVRVVRGELHQVFANLLANAIDATPVGGNINFRLAQDDTSGVTIAFEDSGPGIAPHALPHLFEPFFTTKKDVGTGLGLWVSRQLMERMGGRILFASNGTSAATGGACFTIQLPVITTAGAAV